MGESKFCVKCGKSIPMDAEFCPYCGTTQPVIDNLKATTDKSTEPIAPASSGTPNKTKKPFYKTAWFVCLVVVLILGAAGGGAFAYHQHQVAVAKQALIDKNDNFNDADSEFSTVANKLARQLETFDNQTTKIWHDAIFEDSVTVNGQSYTDFSKALEAHSTQWQDNGKADKMKSNKDYMKDNYDRLSANVTSTNRDQYNTDKKIYNDVKDYWGIVTQPSGTYNDYSANSTSAHNKLVADFQ